MKKALVSLGMVLAVALGTVSVGGAAPVVSARDHMCC